MNPELRKINLMLHEAESHSVRRMWEVRAHQPLPQRVAKVAMVMAFRSSTIRGIVRSHPAIENDFPWHELKGEGCEQKVYAKGKKVLKHMKAMDRYAGMSVDDVAHKLQTNSDRAKEHLGQHWLKTDFDVVVLPFSGERVVVARQPLITPDASYYQPAQLAADTSVDSAAKRDFAEKLQDFHGATGLHADLIGANNVVSVNRVLVVPDTIPVEASIQAQPYDELSTIGAEIGKRIHLLSTS